MAVRDESQPLQAATVKRRQESEVIKQGCVFLLFMRQRWHNPISEVNRKSTLSYFILCFLSHTLRHACATILVHGTNHSCFFASC